MNKICILCQQSKSTTDFPWRNKAQERRNNRCKECQKKLSHKHYLNNKDQYAKNNKAYKAETRANARKYIKDYLSKNPCIDCGESDLRVLEFDHVRGSRFDCVTHLYREQELLAEIAKCEVRCANCHRRRHYANRFDDV